MARFVKLEGPAIAYSACADVNKLQEGHIYEVVQERTIMFQRIYRLKGIGGEFNAVSFKEVPTYEVITSKIPVKGRSLELFNRINKDTGSFELIAKSSIIQEVQVINPNRYVVYTQNSVYFVTC